MAITKKIRFEVFKRDGFVCQYCGKYPPETTLEVDHIKPKSRGGGDDINNLITSCFDCNRGKSNIELKRVPNTLLENKEILEEREKQYLEYHKLLARIDKRSNREFDKVNSIYNKYFPNWDLDEQFKKRTLRKFIDELNLFEVCDAMEIACTKLVGSNQVFHTGIYACHAAIKYFCGICWNKIKEKNNG